MANLRNAAARARITSAFADCRACTKDQCPEYCDEMVQCQLDEIIDDLMAPPVACGIPCKTVEEWLGEAA